MRRRIRPVFSLVILGLPPPVIASAREAIQKDAKQGCLGTRHAWIAAPSATARNDGGVALLKAGLMFYGD